MLTRRVVATSLLLSPLAAMPARAAVGMATGAATTASSGTVAGLPGATAGPGGTAAGLDTTLDALRLQAAMNQEVPHLVSRTPAEDARWIGLARAEMAAAASLVEWPQLLVVVDRNPRVQQLVVMLATPSEGRADGRADGWRVLGATRVSTGSQGRFDHYITPRGVFHVTTAILGFRAEGTLNENGIRGLGAKGMRVWDFGWQVAAKGWRAEPGKPDRTPIRLMLHATDPDKLEQRIGQPASQGCIRVPSALNRFLDRHGVLDAEYEKAAASELRFRALLPPDRQPTPLAGNTLVVVDSGEKPGVDVASRSIP